MTDKPRIVVTRRLPPHVEDRLAAGYEPLFNPEDEVLAAVEVVARAQAHRADGLLVTITDRIGRDVIERLPDSVRVISTFSVGFNHIDLDAAKARGIVVTYTPEAVTDATADLTLMLILAACRKATEYEAQLRDGRWDRWTAWKDLGIDPGGRILGIVGMGRIGRAVAARAKPFGMTIHYHQRRRLAPELEDGAVYHDSLEGLFHTSRIVSLHTPSTTETRGFINRERLGWLPDGAVFVNTARGDQVDDDALIEALTSGRLAAAGLDVFNNEPDVDPRYRAIPNATLLPHIGTSTVETRDRMGFDAIANLDAFFAGKAPPWRLV